MNNELKFRLKKSAIPKEDNIFTEKINPNEMNNTKKNT